jgi:hypothetical protein
MSGGRAADAHREVLGWRASICGVAAVTAFVACQTQHPCDLPADVEIREIGGASDGATADAGLPFCPQYPQGESTQLGFVDGGPPLSAAECNRYCGSNVIRCSALPPCASLSLGREAQYVACLMHPACL